MSRNDSRRQRVKPQPQQPKPPTQAASNPFAAAFVVPTEFVDLPTRGLFYSEESPLFQIENLEIKHMTAREEDILGNQDFISRGIVLDKLIESVLLDKNIKAADLADVDKIAILTTARKTGYGSEYKHYLVCTECEEEEVFTFDLGNLIDNANSEIREAPEGLFVESSPGMFNIELENCGYTAICRPLNNEDNRYILDLEKQRSKHSLDYNYTIEFLRRMIIAVHRIDSPSDSTSDPGTISQFLDFIPAADSKKLKKAHSYLTPSFRMHEEIECPSCSSVTEREVPFSWAMFWGDS